MAEAATDFYYMTGCPWCVSAHVALQEAGVQYNSHTLDLRAGDQNKKEIRALNPRGTVPIFVDEGPIALNSALAIITWIQDHHISRGQNLLPPATDEKHRALVWQRLADSQGLADKVTAPIRFKLRDAHKPMNPEDEVRFGELIGQLRTELGFWDSYLTASLHVACDDYTVADIAAAPFLLLAEHVGATYAAFPHVQQYLGRIRDRQAVAKVLEMHGQAGTQQGNVFGGVV